VPDAVAVITDIHANLPALEAALMRLDELGIDRIFCGGDLVGYGPHPNEVCDLIQARDIPTIYGNYDDAIARDLDDCGCAYVTPHDREAQAVADQVAAAGLPTQFAQGLVAAV
jgi:predicted phosphodiesterase